MSGLGSYWAFVALEASSEDSQPCTITILCSSFKRESSDLSWSFLALTFDASRFLSLYQGRLNNPYIL
jgi:hypothetical protein